MKTLSAPISMTQDSDGPTQRWRLLVQGRVQGVGFRPFVWQLATAMGLQGQVANDLQGAWVEVQGAAPQLTRFCERLRQELPQPGQILDLSVQTLPVAPGSGFDILASQSQGVASAQVLPDLDVCPECLHELFDPSDRRYRYPFLNCTHCGPRYSVILDLPYDRERSTLRGFPLCPECQAEYDNPSDRRYHAQPVACPRCGPKLWFVLADGSSPAGEPLAQAEALLREGGLVAIKGLGGFHLACRADDDAAVERLRARKGREAKPLAVMVDGLDAARAYAHVDAAAEAALSSPVRPIVLLRKRAGARLAQSVAPDTGQWGLMLPATPLHHLLLRDLGLPLVMTSGNPSQEPLCAENDEAMARLDGLADGYLLHDRPIARRVDDSVVVALDSGEGGGSYLLPLRRARGLVPGPLALDFEASEPVLALGGDLKSALCLVTGKQAVLSEHLGDLAHPAAFRNFLSAQERLCRLLRTEPLRLAADLHPDYVSTRWAQRQGLDLTLVQHHHAHVVSAMVEHGLHGPVVGVACDGTGYGTDGGIWGGEILVCDRAAWRRAAHLAIFPLMGGDAAAHEPWRPALGWLQAALPETWTGHLPRLERMAGKGPVSLAVKRMQGPSHAVACSSLGRLFDAAAALLGFCDRNRYESEAAMILQQAAEAEAARGGVGLGSNACALPWAVRAPLEPGEPRVMDTAPLLKALLAGGDPGRLALGFHLSVAGMLAEGARQVAEENGLKQVLLSGGCFANGLLVKAVALRLRGFGLQPLLHRHVPCGDGGLALGQAVVACQRIPAAAGQGV
jgi:hydrogenase maturation protein HypF